MANEIYEPQLRIQATFGKPLLSGEGYQVGFYDAGVMREVINYIAEKTGEEAFYQVYTLPIPDPQIPSQALFAREYINADDVLYSLVDKDKIVVTKTSHPKGWMSYLNELGYEVLAGAKTNKRLKSFHRPTLLNAHFDHLNILYVNPTDYCRYNFNDSNDDMGVASWLSSEEITNRLLDGGFVISRRLIEYAVQNVPSYIPDGVANHASYYYDARSRENCMQDLLNETVYNARIIYQDGFLKGNALCVNLPEDIDVITFRENVKSEIRYHRGFRFLAEPQGPKDKVITDDQTVINLPKLFDPKDLEMWLVNEYDKMFDDAINNRMLTSWKNIYKRTWKDDENLNDAESNAQTNYVGHRWIAGGNNVTDSPWLFESVAISHAMPLKGRVPIPCSCYEQVIPESLARLAGYDMIVPEDSIVRCTPLGVHVVNDLNWLEMYESHGGMDEDDFFKIFYRTMCGGDYDQEKVVIICRSPNGFGEYSILNYVEGQWAPSWEKADGTVIQFPEIDGTEWPRRLSEAIFANQVSFTGLPSESLPKKIYSGNYTSSNVANEIAVAMAGGNVGGFVNAAMAHSMIVANHRPIQLCTLETVIDKCINPDDIDDVLAIDREAKAIMKEVLSTGKPMDKDFFIGRGLRRFLKYGETIEFYDGPITTINKMCMSYLKAYQARIREWSQTNIKPRQSVERLSKRLYFHALPVLRNHRMALYNENSSQLTQATGAIERNSWENLYDGVVAHINTFERLEDRHDFMISLMYAALTVPTETSNKITDQIVMNRQVYPYLEQAMQFYGLSIMQTVVPRNGDLVIIPTRNVIFPYPDENDHLIHHTDPLDFQRAHAKYTMVVFDSEKPVVTQKLTKSLY